VHGYCREQTKDHAEFSDYRVGDLESEAIWWGPYGPPTEESVLHDHLPQLLNSAAVDIKHAHDAHASCRLDLARAEASARDILKDARIEDARRDAREDELLRIRAVEVDELKDENYDLRMQLERALGREEALQGVINQYMSEKK
jgi:hypothetical protein